MTTQKTLRVVSICYGVWFPMYANRFICHVPCAACHNVTEAMADALEAAVSLLVLYLLRFVPTSCEYAFSIFSIMLY